MSENYNSYLPAIRKSLDGIVATLLVIIMLLLVVDVTWQVASRYLLRAPSPFTDELARFLLIWLGLIGAAYAVGQKIHLAIDLLFSTRPKPIQLKIQKFIHVIVFFFSILVMVYGGSKLALLAFELGQRSAALSLELGYIYLAVPINGILSCAYSVLNFLSDQDTDEILTPI